MSLILIKPSFMETFIYSNSCSTPRLLSHEPIDRGFKVLDVAEPSLVIQKDTFRSSRHGLHYTNEKNAQYDPVNLHLFGIQFYHVIIGIMNINLGETCDTIWPGFVRDSAFLKVFDSFLVVSYPNSEMSISSSNSILT